MKRAMIACVLGMAMLAASANAMPESEYEAAKNEAMRGSDPFASIRAFDKLLARTDLTTDQRALALYGRSIYRCGNGRNTEGCVADLQEMLRIAPNYRLANSARSEIKYAQGQIAATEKRLKYGNGKTGAEAAAQHFSDLLNLGRHDEAIAYMRQMKQAGYTPYPTDMEALFKMRRLCPLPPNSGVPGFPVWEMYEGSTYQSVYLCTDKK